MADSMQRSPTCPNCCRNFVTRDQGNSCYPLLLKCGHTYCEGCLIKLARLQKTAIACPTCQVSTPLPKAEQSVRSLWPDIYTLGRLVVNKRFSLESGGAIKPSQKTRNVVDNGEVASLPTVDKQKKHVSKCAECNTRNASCRCAKCECDLCGLCFDKVHQVSRTLMRHQASPLIPDGMTSGCQAHNNRIIEFYCQDDKTSICSHCVVMGDHKNHNIVSILDKNKEVAAEIEPAILVAKTALRRIKEADKVLTDAIPGLRTEVAQLTHEVRTHFQMLHGALQAREISLLEQIEEAGQAQVQPLEGMRNTLVEHAKMLDSLAKDAHRALKNTQTLLNATEIVDKLSSADDLPCCAVASEQKGPAIHCSWDKSLVDVISSYGTVEGNSKPRYNLRRISEVPPEWVQQMPVQPENEAHAEVNGAESDSSVDRFGSQDSSQGGDDTSSKDSSPRQTRRQRVRTSWKPSRWELVFVTHIKHPCHFLVQRLSDNDRVDAMMKAINRFCNSQEPEHVSMDNITVGDLCLAQYSFDHKWYRGRIRAISGGTSDDSSDSGTDKKELMVEVAYVDYGNSELVPIKRLRKMPQRFQTIPEMSMCCSLVDIVPIDKETGKWSQEAIQAFAKMVGDKPVLMKILNHSGSLLHVDLHKPPNEDIDTDMPVSLRDALVFLEVAYLRSPHSVPSFTASVLQPRRKFLPAEPLLQGQDIPVLGSHVMGPDLFYVQVISVAEAQYMRDMMTQMQELYNQEQGEEWDILCPREGMVLVAKYEEDDLWYRAQVVDLPGNKQVDITYVDFGNSARVTCSQLKKIPDKFLKLPVQAVPCVLADVEPCDVSKGWSDEARIQFNQLTLFKSLVVNVQGKTADSKLKVLLYDPLDRQTCINSLLVQEGHGTCTGQGLQTAPVPVPEETVNADSVDMQVPEEPAGTDIQEVPLSHSSSVELEPTLPLEPEPTREIMAKAPETSPNNGDLDIDPCRAPPLQEGENCLPVTVCHVESPAQVFVQLASAGEDGLDSLMSEMEEHYRESEPSLISWKEQDICCVKYSVDNRWYRARVSCSKGNNSFEIFHLDYGSREVVSVDNLRPLPEKFQYLPAFAICCHLANLVPAGGKNTWTATACEFLSSLVTNIPCTLVTKGPVEEGSLPVDLLYEHRIQETALTAAKANLISVSQSLIHEGVALRKKRTNTSLKSESASGPQPSENTATVDHNYNVKNISEEPPASGEADKIPEEEDEEVDEKWRYRKPHLPAKEQFPIAITFINSKAIIYGQEIKEDNNTLENLMFTLQKQNEMTPELTNGSGCYKWKVGEPCQAQFTQDQHWYRAKVLKVTEQGVEVQYVDFGNTEVLPAHSLRKLKNLMTIPQQCLEMELFGVWPISPDGAWPTEAVLFLLENVMGQTCLAILKSKPSKGPLRVELVLGDGQNVGEMMVNRGLAAPGKKPCGELMYPAGEEVTELLDSLKAVQRSPQRLPALKGVPAEERGYQTPSDDDSCSDEDDAAYCPPFAPAMLPPPGQHFKINITHVDQPNQMYFQRVMADDDEDSEEDPTLAETQRQLQLLETITEEIVAQVDTFHPLDNIIAVLCEGMACCACYTMDDSWYRAQVISVQSLDPLAVWVLYVDYGTSELLMADRLKQLPERYQTLPMQATKCTLLGVQPAELTGQESGLLPESTWTHQALKAMITAVDNKVLTACIKDPGPPPSLLLFESISPKPRLVVQSLVEQGLAVPDTTGLEGIEWVLDNMAASHSPEEVTEEELEQEVD